MFIMTIPGSEYLYPLQNGAEDRPLYADGYPYLMLSRPSIDSLNSVLKTNNVDLTVEETRFRPNIFINGSFPGFQEDKYVLTE